MIELVNLCSSFLASTLKSRTALQAENLAFRHQLCVYQRSIKSPKATFSDVAGVPEESRKGYRVD